MSTKKLSLKELREFHDKTKYMEGAIWQAYGNLNEIMTITNLLKQHLKSEGFNKWQLESGLEALLTLLINCQGQLVDQANLED